MPQTKEFLRIADAAAQLGVDYKTVYRLIRSGRLPASKPAGLYLIRLEDVARLLEEGKTRPAEAASAVLANPTVERCGRCLRLIEHDGAVGGVCAHPGCDEILCSTCWQAGSEAPERLCHKHSLTREQRYAAVRREQAAGRVPVLVSAAQARQLELTFISRLDQKIRQIVTVKNPISGAVAQNPNWEASFTTGDASNDLLQLLNVGFLDGEAKATLPLYPRLAYVLPVPTALTLEARVLGRMERHIADGFDAEPLMADTVVREITQTLEPTAGKTSRAHVLALASATGWTKEALDYVASTQPGRAFSHRWLLPYLVDLGTGQVAWNTLDPRAAPFAPLFAVLLPEEEIQIVTRAVRAALMRHDSLTLAQATVETQVADGLVRSAFDRLVATGSFVVVDVPGLGPAITRR